MKGWPPVALSVSGCTPVTICSSGKSVGTHANFSRLQVSPKKPASRLLAMLALARDHAIAKGLNRDKLVIGASSPSLLLFLTKANTLAQPKHGRRKVLHSSVSTSRDAVVEESSTTQAQNCTCC